MYSRAALLALGIMAFSPWIASVRADAVEPQKTDPKQCQEHDKASDKDCVRDWFSEYTAGLLAEFKYYAGQEDFLSEMLADPQETLLTARLSLILIEGGTRFSQWAALQDEEAAKTAGLDMPRYRAILGVCRDAISGMRAALFDLRQHRDRARLEASQYVKDATACERVFGLAAKASKLRNAGEGKHAATPPATTATPDRPLDIEPRRHRP
jgi:hypothetical protein